MSKKTTWADVRKHDVVELGGREYRVVKCKAGKKKADVVVDYKGRYSSSTVKLSDRVTIVKKGDGTKKGPLYDESGTARRWATKKEARAAEPKGLAKGDASQTKPPAKPGPDLWETPHGKVERMIGDLLSARLVAETPDESAGYYVPPADVSTIAAHLALFHGGIPEACNDDEGRMIEVHARQHVAALSGEGVLAVNHWHTAKRP